MIRLLTEADAQLICGGGLLDISILDDASFGNGNNVNLGYFPQLTSQATTGGIAGSFNDNFSNNTATLAPPTAAPEKTRLLGRFFRSSRR
jgi:hypothetical protein